MILLWDVLHAIIKRFYLEKGVPHVLACPVISALWRLRCEDSEFKANLGYTRELMYYTTSTSGFIVNNSEHLGVRKLLNNVCMVTSDSDLFLATYPVVKQCLKQLYVFVFLYENTFLSFHQ